jgi:Lysine methyltransferase
MMMIVHFILRIKGNSPQHPCFYSSSQDKLCLFHKRVTFRRFLTPIFSSCHCFQSSPCRILELGSGTGILGMTMARNLGLTTNPNHDDNTWIKNNKNQNNSQRSIIVLTDGDDKAIELLKSNVLHRHNQIDTKYTKVIPLFWFTKCDPQYNEKRLQFLQTVQTSFYYNSNSYRVDIDDDDDHVKFNSQEEKDDSSCLLIDQNNNETTTTTTTTTDDGNVNTSATHDDDDGSLLFDTIIAGDVLYKESLLPLFFDTVLTFLKKTKYNKNISTLYLCHIPRNNVTQEMVQQYATQSGLVYTIIPIPNHIQNIVPTIHQPNDDDDDGCYHFPLEDVDRAVVYRMCMST